MTSDRGGFVGAGVLCGLGLGGFFDGIVLHQLLQWHHLLSSWFPPTSIENLRLNTRWDGVFHSATYLFVLAGLWRFWRLAEAGRARESAARLAGALLVGWGVFNVVEGLVDHTLLGIHHVNELVPRSQWPAWDLGFLAWGTAMWLGGMWLLRARRGAPPERRR